MKTTPRVPPTLGQVPVHIIAPADPAQQSTDPTRGMSGRFPPGPCGPSLRNLRLASTRRPSPRRSAAEPRPAGRNTAPSASPSTNASKLCPLTVAFEHFRGGKDLQQVLLAANRKNDLSLLATKMI